MTPWGTLSYPYSILYPHRHYLTGQPSIEWTLATVSGQSHNWGCSREWDGNSLASAVLLRACCCRGSSSFAGGGTDSWCRQRTGALRKPALNLTGGLSLGCMNSTRCKRALAEGCKYHQVIVFRLFKSRYSLAASWSHWDRPLTCLSDMADWTSSTDLRSLARICRDRNYRYYIGSAVAIDCSSLS